MPSRFKRHHKFSLYLLFSLLNALLLTSQVYAESEYEELIELVNKDISHKGVSAALLTVRADIYLENGLFDKANRDYNAALKLEPHYWKSIYGLSQVLFAKNKAEEALKRLETIPQCDPKNGCMVSVLYLKAQIFTKIKQDSHAIESLDELISLSENTDSSIYLWRADLCEKNNNLEQALNGLLEGLKIHPNVPALVERTLLIEEKLGKIDQAIAQFDLLLDASSRKDEILLKKSEFLSRQGRVVESKEAALKGLDALHSLPNLVQSRDAVQAIASKLEKLSKALIQ